MLHAGYVYINNLHICTRGAKDLSKALAHNSSLEHFYIEHNVIGDQGIAHLVKSLKKNQTLKHLNVIQCGITETGLAAAANVLCTQRRVDILYEILSM